MSGRIPSQGSRRMALCSRAEVNAVCDISRDGGEACGEEAATKMGQNTPKKAEFATLPSSEIYLSLRKQGHVLVNGVIF